MSFNLKGQLMNYKALILSTLFIFGISFSAIADEENNNDESAPIETTKKNSKDLDINKKQTHSVKGDHDKRGDHNINNNSDQDTISDHDSRGSSESARARKHFGVALKSGLAVGLISGSGLDGYMNLNPKLQFGLSYVMGTLDLKSSVTALTGANIDKLNLNVSLIEAYAKYFVGNSFALIGGLGYRNINSDISVTSTTGSKNTATSKSTGTAFVAKIGLGNYWSWKSGFTLGCEWVGYLTPLSSAYSSDSSGVSTASMASLNNSANDLSKTFASTSTAQFLNLAIGYSF